MKKYIVLLLLVFLLVNNVKAVEIVEICEESPKVGIGLGFAWEQFMIEVKVIVSHLNFFMAGREFRETADSIYQLVPFYWGAELCFSPFTFGFLVLNDLTIRPAFGIFLLENNCFFQFRAPFSILIGVIF